MEINADFDQKIIIHSEQLEWIKSPMPGVDRRPLDRVGGEIARATSIVRYAPGSKFSMHTHTGGEEFIVLEGVFQDEHGDYPAGSYIRNPPMSHHTPGSDAGCIIFVKLWQFDPADRKHVNIDMSPLMDNAAAGRNDAPCHTLYNASDEDVSLVTLRPGARHIILGDRGAEILLLNGEGQANNQMLHQYSWLRSPAGQNIKFVAGPAGADIWVKRNHLTGVERQISRVLDAANNQDS